MNRKRIVIGVMGGGNATEQDIATAYKLGALIGKEGWSLLNGGRPSGIMEASAKGARDQGGITIGILPGTDPSSASEYIDVPICTGMGDARNVINVLSSDIIIACPGSGGTISEIALALKNKRAVILLNFDVGPIFDRYVRQGLLLQAKTPEEAIILIKKILASEDQRSEVRSQRTEVRK